MSVLPDVYVCSHRKKSTPLHSKFTEDTNWNKRKWHYSQNKDLSRKWYCQTLKAFRIISSEMKISLLIWRWWCFSCQHIQRIDIQYTDQFVLKNNSLGIADIIFINKLQFLTFSFSNLQNLLKCMGSMFPCYSLLNMKVIWLHMVSAPLPIAMGWVNLKICQILWWQNLSYICGRINPYGWSEKFVGN